MERLFKQKIGEEITKAVQNREDSKSALLAVIRCYICGVETKDTPLGILDLPEGWGWVWGSDGVFPEEASACYACPNCKDSSV